MMKLLSWNSRGMGHPSKTTALRDLLHNERPEILLIQETKKNQNEMQKIIDAQRHFSGVISSSRGASGGIVTMWNNQNWDCNSTIYNQNWIRTNLNSKEENCDLIIYNVYIPNHYREKEQCWKELKENIDNEQTSNIILAGDFNLILHANEKRGGNFMHDPFRSHLEGIMLEHEMVDIIPKNRKYTWNNRRLGPGNIMERLDRILVNITLLSSFAACHTKILSSIASDHFPILLTMESHLHLGPILFRYNPLWRNNSSAEAIIEATWKQHVEGSPSHIWETKIRSVRKALKEWAKIRSLLTEVQEEVDYSELLQYLPKGITQGINESLNREIEEEEIRKAIWTLQPDKSPGLDGFPINFYRDHWQLIKKDLAKMLRGIQRKGKMGGFTNSTFLALIPKENQPTSFSRFQPISLCNSSYKIFTKIIAMRLQPLLPSLISENQGGFLSNRQIHDTITLVQEAIHSSSSRQEKGFVLKLDLANAFDRVSHSFLFVVLGKMGFNSSFINTIAACISGPWISPLINGRPCEAFQSSRGLRQGCPLSPYLFILMAESFSKALDHNRRVGLITGIKLGNGVKNINHSQFADDTLLIGGASTTIARRFKILLDQYMDYSGGAVNFHKSCVYG
eukprot:PITA_10539